MTGLVPAEELYSLFPMKKHRLTRVQSELKEGEDVRWYSLWLTNPADKLVFVEFTLPEPDETGVIKVKETYKVVISVAKKGADYDLHPNSLNNVWVSPPKDIVKWAIRDALSVSITPDAIDLELLQDRIDAFLAVNPAVRPVNPSKPIDRELAQDTILIETVTNYVDYQQRQYNDWLGKIDLITTSQGRYVGQVFRVTEGVTYDKGRMVSSNALFCRTMKKNLLFPENNRPDRLQMARSMMARHEAFIYAEEPLVAHESYDGKLHGMHLNTAVMSHPLNYYDCIVVSESAASRMGCYKNTRQTVIDTEPYRVTVSEGDSVQPGDVLLESSNKKIRATKIKINAYISKIVRTGTMVGRIPATRYVFHFVQCYPLESGDKLSSRHSSKGVTRILSTTSMPYILKKTCKITLDMVLESWYDVHKLTYGHSTERSHHETSTGQDMRSDGVHSASGEEQDAVRSPSEAKEVRNDHGHSGYQESQERAQDRVLARGLQPTSSFERAVCIPPQQREAGNETGSPKPETGRLMQNAWVQQTNQDGTDVQQSLTDRQEAGEEPKHEDLSEAEQAPVLLCDLQQGWRTHQSAEKLQNSPAEGSKCMPELQLQGHKSTAGSQDEGGEVVQKGERGHSVCKLSSVDTHSPRRVQPESVEEGHGQTMERLRMAAVQARAGGRDAPPEDPVALAEGTPGVIYEKEAGEFWRVEKVVLDILIHPRSLVGRRNLGVLREIMSNKRAKLEGPKRVKHFSEDWSMAELTKLGYGDTEFAYHGDEEELGEVFYGPLYWLRTDKHAADTMSVIGKDKPVDQHGMNPDSGRSGQRMGPDIAAVLTAKGLRSTLRVMLSGAVEPAALSRAATMLECLE